ncbi:type II toxin-antitoxin system VapC family toxin [Lacihabitans sp. CCS-44]|uniref:type II toxin-antitoxin system VapC family toxin n=1 Tax=Lacihabitans sp. CCS-44 TaxID=2487331 RepID=UPI0020CB8005|nr:type II toxin-antitoxin system VapC family toxin [Lacihabitans sp. CCS-44]MCP9755125.1 type II toxin-antitoxin system VapC family toxin [Lacihabitans sp. CCS-44]
MVIFDTNILIEIYRGNESIKKDIYIHNFENIYISDITAAEFLIGARDKKELALIKKVLNFYTSIPINTSISNLSVELCEKFTLSHKPSIPDLLIASTSIHYNIPLYTLNKKDFVYLPNLTLI